MDIASWSTFEGTLMVLRSYFKHGSSSCYSTCRVTLEGTATCSSHTGSRVYETYAAGWSEESECVYFVNTWPNGNSGKKYFPTRTSLFLHIQLLSYHITENRNTMCSNVRYHFYFCSPGDHPSSLFVIVRVYK